MPKAIAENHKNLRLVKLMEVMKVLSPDEKSFLKEYLEKENTWEHKFNKMLKEARHSFKKHLKASGHDPERLTEKDIERILDELQNRNAGLNVGGET